HILEQPITPKRLQLRRNSQNFSKGGGIKDFEGEWKDVFSFMEQLEESPENVSTLANLLPQLHLRKREDMSLDKEDVAKILQRVISKFSEACKAVILLDDAQWIDPVSVEILSHIFKDSENIMAVLFSRSIEKSTNNISKALENIDFTHIHLNGLSKEALQKMILSKFGDGGATSVIEEVLSDWVSSANGVLTIDIEVLRSILGPGLNAMFIIQFDR
ncbi:hypothetical protein HDU67_009438, partial [Dinochytrium kinnereticum]